MRTLVLGDPHGAHKAMLQVFKESKMDYSRDRLICLGDVADGWPDVPQCFDELLRIKNLIFIMGNHDYWLLNWFKNKTLEHIWLSQGGKATLNAYENITSDLINNSIESHKELLSNKSQYYFVDEKNRVFVHGGFDWRKPICETTNSELMWDRKMYTVAKMWDLENKRLAKKGKYTIKERFKNYNEIFIGHTTTEIEYLNLKPVNVCNL